MKYLALLVLLVSVVVTLVLFGDDLFNKNVHRVSESVDHTAVALEDGVYITNIVRWPVPGSVPETDVLHSIPLNEIKQGCARQDCIPSVDTPEFIGVTQATQLLAPESLGIALSYKGVDRFYPFPMLETHELVNDVVAGDPLLISYCPLCGTGIVFERMVEGTIREFGVSGMLWQSNLLMYNKAESLANRNLWSQVLGQAVVGEMTGQKLTQIPSDIMQFGAWASVHPNAEVLTTGRVRDPYAGAYYDVAKRFNPDFDEAASKLPPMSYVYGIEVDGVFKAYPAALLTSGVHTDTINGVTLTIVHKDGMVTFTTAEGTVLSDVEGFWFSWKAAHPDTTVWNNS